MRRTLITMDEHHPLGPRVRAVEVQTMDPNATLEQIRDLVAEIQRLEAQREDPPDPAAGASRALLVDLAHLADELAAAVEVLDTWLAHGGFLPRRWIR